MSGKFHSKNAIVSFLGKCSLLCLTFHAVVAVCQSNKATVWTLFKYSCAGKILFTFGQTYLAKYSCFGDKPAPSQTKTNCVRIVLILLSKAERMQNSLNRKITENMLLNRFDIFCILFLFFFPSALFGTKVQQY